MFCCALLCVHRLDGEERAGCFALFVFLVSPDWCIWLFLTTQRVCLQIVIAVFPDHIHLLFLPFFRSNSGFVSSLCRACTGPALWCTLKYSVLSSNVFDLLGY